jgi:alkylated DNA repair dioxygenase AlkB
MDLFNDVPQSQVNLLPKDGTVKYYGRIMSRPEADQYFHWLSNNIDWKYDQAVVFGNVITTKRLVAWYGDKPFEYTYSKVTKRALPWTPELLALKRSVEAATGETFNSCLLNLYPTGAEGMAWHSDGEKDLKRNGAIGSLTLGAERKFSFKHKHTKETVSLVLQHGSLLVMKGTTQRYWLHRLPPTRQRVGARINLTFRTIVG